MKYSIKKLPKSQAEISVTLPPAEFKHFYESALQEFAQKIEIPGFRAGKAPLALVKEKVNAGHILERALEAAAQKNLPEIAQKEALDIIGQSTVSVKKIPAFQPGETETDVEYTIAASLFPTIVLPDYISIAKNINKERKTPVIEEKEIDESLAWLRESRVKHITVSRAAQKGDRVEVDFTVKDNGVVIEGGTSKNHPVILGEGKFVPGFEDMVLGMKEGEEKRFTLTMPKEYPNNLGGKELDFHVIVKLVQERQLPDLTDDFVQGLGKFGSVAELRNSIREGLMREKEEKERQRLDITIAEEIARHISADIPDLLTDRETEKMFHEFEASIAKMGMDMGHYLEHIKKSPEDLKKEWRPDAEKRVKIALALRAIADKENIEPTDEEVSAKANNSLDVFRAEGHDIQKIDKQALAEYSKSILRNEKVFQFLENQK